MDASHFVHPYHVSYNISELVRQENCRIL